MVTNSYRAGGAGGFAAALAGARVIDRSQQTVRDLVIALLHRARPRPARAVWRFAPLPRTGAWFDTAPSARAGAIPGRVLDDLGPRPDGFRRFRLRFDG